MIFFTIIALFVVVEASVIVEPVHQPQPYKFGYTVKDKEGVQHREEAGNGAGVVEGNYAIVDNKGLQRQVNYVADHAGFRAAIKTNEPGTAGQSPAAVVMMSNDPYAQGAAVPYVSRVNDPVVPALQTSDAVYGFPTVYGPVAKAPYSPVYGYNQAVPLYDNVYASSGLLYPSNNGLVGYPGAGAVGYGNGYGLSSLGSYGNLLGAGYRNPGGIVNFGANLVGGVIKGYDSRFTNL